MKKLKKRKSKKDLGQVPTVSESEVSKTEAKPKKKRKTYVKFDDFLGNNEIALTNAQLPAVYPYLEKMGYTDVLMQQKLDENVGVRKLYSTQQGALGKQYQATKDLKDWKATCHEGYIEHLETARLAFANDIAADVALGLKGARKAKAELYIAQAKQFYKGVIDNADYAAILLKKGIDKATLTTSLANIDQLEKLLQLQQHAKGDAQAATKALNAGRKALQKWMTEFKKYAKIALKKQPSLLVMLGY